MSSFPSRSPPSNLSCLILFVSADSLSCLTIVSAELDENYDLRKGLDFTILIHRFSEMSGVVFSDSVLSYETGNYLRLRWNDVLSLNSRFAEEKRAEKESGAEGPRPGEAGWEAKSGRTEGGEGGKLSRKSGISLGAREREG
jgi:hypothetical protein